MQTNDCMWSDSEKCRDRQKSGKGLLVRFCMLMMMMMMMMMMMTMMMMMMMMMMIIIIIMMFNFTVYAYF